MGRRNYFGQFTNEFTGTVLEKFERQYSPVPVAGCWIWTGAVQKNGYGAFSFGNGRGAPTEGAHRAAWRLYVGSIPDGLRVLHRCDTPLCVNPHHLFIGTHQDNMDDKVKKERQVRGEKTWNAKATAEMVLQIRGKRMLKSRVLAEIYGISRQAVNDILTGRTWKHV